MPDNRAAPSLVAVLDRHGKPLMPCHPARARELLRKGRAVVAHFSPFVIRLKDRTLEQSSVEGVQVGIDPGSKHTGIAVFGFGSTTGNARKGLFSAQVDHRSQKISKAMTSRSHLRRARRSRTLRYRPPRFANRRRPKGWLAPSLRHRVEGVRSWASKLQRWFPITGWHMELVRFDMQLLDTPEISGVEYQNGTLAGYELREYLLEKWHRTCAYCDASDVPLNLDHIHPKSKGGGNRATNFTLACIPCNQRKGAQDVAVFVTDPKRLSRILAQAKRPLRDAAAVNSTRWALLQSLRATGLSTITGTGGQTKYNRHQLKVPKSHTLDALCVGQVEGLAAWPATLHLATSTGRGTYQRTATDKYGFPNRTFSSAKSHFGFTTGDLVTATVPVGKHRGVHTGRVSVRAGGQFVITTRTGKVESRHTHCTLLQRADGWQHDLQTEQPANVT